jgi:hypothetical protein
MLVFCVEDDQFSGSVTGSIALIIRKFNVHLSALLHATAVSSTNK